MRSSVPYSLLPRLSELVATQTGLHFPEDRWGDLERGIIAAARELDFPDVQSCVQRLLSEHRTHKQIEMLASHLTVGETYFFREKNSFEALEGHIFPELFRGRKDTGRPLQIWSAGCCSGEEPYSIAMLLDRLLPPQQEWTATIRATDINVKFLRKAAEGVYGDWSFRDTPAWIRDRYFTPRKGRRFEIQSAIRERVSFSYLNLATDAYPSHSNNTHAMNVIFCRNVLMYFTAERARKVVENFYRSLVDGGWLILSPAETSSSLFARFTAVEFPGVVLFRKVTGAQPRPFPTAHAGPELITAAPESLESLQPRSLRDEFPECTNGNAIGAISSDPARLEAATPTVESSGAFASNADGPDENSLLIARACANQGRLQEAIEWCEKAITADKLDPAGHYLLATIRQEQGQSRGAALSLLRALYLKPDFILAHFALGNLRLSQGRPREAERHFDHALARLHTRPQDEILPESDGLTAGRLGAIIASARSGLTHTASGHKQKTG
jgi:chemotaxis protein methyltransferase CheR